MARPILLRIGYVKLKTISEDLSGAIRKLSRRFFIPVEYFFVIFFLPFSIPLRVGNWRKLAGGTFEKQNSARKCKTIVTVGKRASNAAPLPLRLHPPPQNIQLEEEGPGMFALNDLVLFIEDNVARRARIMDINTTTVNSGPTKRLIGSNLRYLCWHSKEKSTMRRRQACQVNRGWNFAKGATKNNHRWLDKNITPKNPNAMKN